MPENSADKKEINWKSVLIGVVIGAVLIGLGVCIYLLLQPKPKESKPIITPKTTTETTTETTKTTPACASTLTDADKIEIQLWKTYENSKYKYSFKYPETWQISSQSDELLRLRDQESEIDFEFGVGTFSTNKFRLSAPIETTVACEKAIKYALISISPDSDITGNFVEFSKNSVSYHIVMSYKYIGASLSSDIVEAYALILKSIEFK